MEPTTPVPVTMVTFLFTDIEGSTRLWEQHPEAMQAALAHHDALLSRSIQDHNGSVFKTVGDAFYATFTSALDGISAALSVQLALASGALAPEPHHPVIGLRVRMALHTSTAQTRGGDYFGPALNRVARLLAAAHGGQTLLSEPTSDLVREALPEGMSLRDLGCHHLKDLQQPERIFQLVHPELPSEFPSLRTVGVLDDHMPFQLTSLIGQEQEVADKRGLVLFLEETASIIGATGHAERAARLFGAAAALRDALGAPRPAAGRDDYERDLLATGAQLGPRAFAAAWAEGQAMSAEQAIAAALEAKANT
jgi:class 3 adenylate cyclase